MIKQHLMRHLREILAEALEAFNLSSVDEGVSALNIERPRQADHGDYAINVSPLARFAKKAPPVIAQTMAEAFVARGFTCNVMGGFLNFHLQDAQLLDALCHLARAEKPGQNDALKDLHCLLEFVSANPTGPLHIGHGRWVALGDSLARLMRHCGATVTTEFYVNDAGTQMFNMANSLWYRSLEILDVGVSFPQKVDDQPYPFYPGEYVKDLAGEFLTTHASQVQAWDSPEHIAPPEAIEALCAFAKHRMLAEQTDLMKTCGLEFDRFFSEKALHEAGAVEAILKVLAERGVTSEQDGALWFHSTQFGDDQDRVLVKTDGKFTYLTADIAYHHEKYQRLHNGTPYNRFINIWGADHHGYIARMKAAMTALGHDSDQLEILLGQLVNLIVDGERTRMGKRKKMLTLAELVDEVGVDAVRFWMVSKSHDTALDFNVELAQSSSDENPVFYVQYAHARCASILRNALQPRLDTVNQTTLPALLTESDWHAFLKDLTPEALVPLMTHLENAQAKTELRELILKLDSFEDSLLTAARQRLPHVMARYTQELSAQFHRFYAVCRILTPDTAQTQVRLVVVATLQRVLAQALALLGVSAPDRM